MSAFHTQVKTYLIDYLKEKYEIEVGDEDIDDMDLIRSGVLSSLGYIELISSLEEHFKIEIDFDEIDPSEFTTLSGLMHLVENTKDNSSE